MQSVLKTQNYNTLTREINTLDAYFSQIPAFSTLRTVPSSRTPLHTKWTGCTKCLQRDGKLCQPDTKLSWVYHSNTSQHRPFDGVRVDPFSFAGVACGDDVSSLPPLPRRLIGLSDGGFGSEGKVGLAGGGPGVVSSTIWAHMFNNLRTANQLLCQVVYIDKITQIL